MLSGNFNSFQNTKITRTALTRGRLTLAIAFALSLPSGLAFAQSDEAAKSEAEEVTSMNEVMVTARRREETIQDVPVAVTAFTETAIADLNIEDMSDVDAYVPNLTVYAARGSNSTVTAYIRGVGQSDPLWGVDPGVGVYLDDVYLARPQGALLDAIDLERIEVLRGPQGSLYGKNTIGGAIKFITKPLKPVMEGRATLVIGTDNQLDTKVSLNAPLGSDSVIARVALASLNRDGFGENILTGAPVSDKEILTGRATLGFFPNDDFNIVFSVDRTEDQGGVRGGRRLNAFNPGDPTRTPPIDDRYDIASGMSNVNDTTMEGASATANWTINDAWWFKSITAYRSSDTDTNIDFDMLPNKIADVRAVYADEQLSQEFQFNYSGENLYGVFGLYWFTGEAGGTVYNNFFNALFGTTNGQVDTDSISFFGEGTYAVNEALSITGGLRFTDEEKTADVLNQGYRNATFTNPISTAADFNDTVSFKNWSPKISVDYKLSDDAMVYGLISRGFKSGGFNIRANVTAVPASATPFDDEVVTSFEVGTKTAWMDQSLFFNASYFYNNYRDIQLSVFSAYDSNGDGTDDAFFGDFTNAGKAHIQGVELELQAKPTDAFSITGNLAWLDAQYDEFLDRGVDVSNVQRFTNAPKLSGALNFAYTMPVMGGDLTARAGVSYQSEVWPTTDLSAVIREGGYSLYNAGLIWRSDDSPWTLALQGSNLGDKEYRTTGYNIPVLGILTGFYGAPRQVSLSATYTF